MPRERTYIMIKPDGVQRGLIGNIVARFEDKGFKLVAMKMATPSKEHLEKHYADLAGKKFFPSLIEYMMMGPVVCMVWEGLNVVKTGRVMLGATNPKDSAPGTIRGDLCIDVGRNICHGSDTVENAKKEIALWFPEGLNSYRHHSEAWVYENVEEEEAAPANATAAADEFDENKCYDDDACLGEEAPKLSTLKMMQGENVDYSVKPTVVLFWAKFLKWQVFPAMKYCQELHEAGDVQVIGVATDPKESSVSRHIQKGECPTTYGLAYDAPQGTGKPGAVKGGFKAACDDVLMVPQVFIINTEGKIVWRQTFSAGFPLADSNFDAQVKRVVAGEPLAMFGPAPVEEEEEDTGAGEAVVDLVDPLAADVQW